MSDRRSTNVKKPNIIGGKGQDNGEQIEIRRTRVERKSFLNGDVGTGKEGKDQTRATRSKENKEQEREWKDKRNKHRRTKKKEKVGKKVREDKKRNRNLHRTYRRLSRITKPPLHLHHGTKPMKMLARRSRPNTSRQNRRRIRCGVEHRTGCATPEPGVLWERRNGKGAGISSGDAQREQARNCIVCL